MEFHLLGAEYTKWTSGIFDCLLQPTLFSVLLKKQSVLQKEDRTTFSLPDAYKRWDQKNKTALTCQTFSYSLEASLPFKEHVLRDTQRNLLRRRALNTIAIHSHSKELSSSTGQLLPLKRKFNRQPY